MLGVALLAIGCSEQKPTPPEATWVVVPFTEYEIAVPADCDFIANDGSERQPLGRSAALRTVQIRPDGAMHRLTIGLAEHHFPNGIRAVDPDLTNIAQVLAQADGSDSIQKFGFWLRDEVYAVVLLDPTTSLVGSTLLMGDRSQSQVSTEDAANAERLEAIIASARPVSGVSEPGSEDETQEE